MVEKYLRELGWLPQYFQEREWQAEGKGGQLRKSTLGQGMHRLCKARDIQAGSRVPRREQVRSAELAQGKMRGQGQGDGGVAWGGVG